jgi:hypothetical protein
MSSPTEPQASSYPVLPRDLPPLRVVDQEGQPLLLQPVGISYPKPLRALLLVLPRQGARLVRRSYQGLQALRSDLLQLTGSRFLRFFGMQFLAYGLVAWNFRVLAKGLIGQTVLSDLLIAAMGYTIIKQVSEAKDWISRMGYILGGAAGSASSILVTKWFLGF